MKHVVTLGSSALHCNALHVLAYIGISTSRGNGEPRESLSRALLAVGNHWIDRGECLSSPLIRCIRRRNGFLDCGKLGQSPMVPSSDYARLPMDFASSLSGGPDTGSVEALQHAVRVANIARLPTYRCVLHDIKPHVPYQLNDFLVGKFE